MPGLLRGLGCLESCGGAVSAACMALVPSSKGMEARTAPARPTGAPATTVHAPAPLPKLSASSPRVQEGRWSEALAAIPLLTCTPDTPFGEVVRQLVGHKKHRWAAALPAPLTDAFSGTNRVQLAATRPEGALLAPGADPRSCAVETRCLVSQAEHHPGQRASAADPGKPEPRCAAFSWPCRVYIVDGEGQAVGVVTPTDVLRLLSA